MSIMPLRPLTSGIRPEADRTPLPAYVPGPGHTVVVMGCGRSGQAAARLCAKLGCRVRLLESGEVEDGLRASLEGEGIRVETGPHRAEQFAGCHFVVPSPGIPLRSVLGFMGLPEDAPLEAVDGARPQPAILAETELAWRLLDGEKVVAVTGTSGKTTTVHLIRAMLEAAGQATCLAGNVGTPLSEYVLERLEGKRAKADAVVLEISSFQLQTCLRLRPDVAVLVNIEPNHLDYHRDMDEYVAAKMRLFACQTADDAAIVPADWTEVWTGAGFAARRSSVTVRGLFPKTRLLGAHNALNAETAYAAVSGLNVSMEAAARAVAAFEPLHHRLEPVAEKGGVLYVNDSKSTTLASMRTALTAMDRPVLLLCGGRFKGGDPKELIPFLRGHVRLVAGFGESEDIFAPAWKDVVPVTWFPTLRPAVEHLAANAREGEVVLLSPGTASFDLYRGMAYRGADFKAIVEGL